jgi:hypothetical protein
MFQSVPLAILQPRTAIAWEFKPETVLRTGFGLFSDLLPGSVADLIGANPPYVNTFQGGLLGTVGGLAIAPGVPDSAVDATATANQDFLAGFAHGELSWASPLANASACLPPVSTTAVPDGTLREPYFMQWSFALEHQFGSSASLHAQYVGTRAVNQPYTSQVNGYQTVCPGCFAPFPYGQPVDPRFGGVTQLSTGANRLQLTAEKRGHGLRAQLNYTWSHCIDTVSNGGFLQFSSGGILSPLPGDLTRDRGPCDYDIRHNLTGNYVYQLPLKVRSHWLGYALNGWEISGTIFAHSGVPFSVLSAPYSAGGNGSVNGSGPEFANVRAGVPLYEHNPIPGVTPPGTLQWLNPNAFISAVDPSSGACSDGDGPGDCQFGNLGRNALRGPDFFWSDFYVTKWFPLGERVKLRVDAQFCSILKRDCGHPRKFFDTNRIRRAHLHHIPADRVAWRRPGRRQLSTHDGVPSPPRILTLSDDGLRGSTVTQCLVTCSSQGGMRVKMHHTALPLTIQGGSGTKNAHSFEPVGQNMGMVMSPQKLRPGGMVTTTGFGSPTRTSAITIGVILAVRSVTWSSCARRRPGSSTREKTTL